jgi:phosphoribosylamine--glycine ligase
MAKYGVRTAISKNFSHFSDADRFVESFFADADRRNGENQGEKSKKLVIKADGLAAGKGVVIVSDKAEALSSLDAFMNKGAMGAAGKTVVLEEFLDGKEVSILAGVSVKAGRGVIAPFISARDHKRRFDHGEGPNTGGMGAIAPLPDFTDQAQADFRANILEPTLRGLKAENFDYRGFLFFGLMVKDNVCSLLEYNVRLGDPETQAVLPLLDADFAALCRAIIDGNLEHFPLLWKKGAVCAPVAVAEGYPAGYRKGDLIEIDAETAESGVKIFIAGAKLADGKLYTAGGRVLAAGAYGENGEEARRKAYNALKSVRFNGMGYRSDIGKEC